MERLVGLEQFTQAIDLYSQAREGRYYHYTKRLMMIYRNVMWCLENDIQEADLDSAELGYEHINQALEILACTMEDDTHFTTLQDQCRSMLFTHALILIIDKALAALKKYPGSGEKYFEIINNTYILQYPYSEDELLAAMNISRSTFYREKRRALSLLGVILWGYTLPAILHSVGDTQLTLN